MAELVPKKPKDMAKVVVLGTGVVWVTPILSPLVSKIGFLTMEVPVVGVTLATMISAGLAASLVQYAIASWWK